MLIRRPNKIVIEQNGVLRTTNVTRYTESGEPVKKELVWIALENIAEKLLVKQQNGDTGINASELADFQALSTLDIDLQARDMPDNIADRLVHDASPKSNGINSSAVTKKVEIREFLDPIGYFKELRGSNDNVHLMDKQIFEDTMTIYMKGLGYKNSLLNTLTNTLDDPSGVNRAFARALTIEKNREVLDPIINASYTGNTIAAATGGTYFENVFSTLIKTVIKVGQNNYTAGGAGNRLVGDMPGRTIILVSNTVADILKLQPSLSSYDRPVAAMLGAEIIGVSSFLALKYGAENPPTITIPVNTAYVIRLPDAQESHLRVSPIDVLSKSGEGDPLEGSPYSIANFRYSGVFNKYLLPNGAGKGCIVQAALPSPSV